MGRVPKVNIYQDKKSGNWGVSYSAKGRRYRRIVASKKHDAMVVAAEALQKLKVQEYDFLEDAQPLKIAELIGLFLESKKNIIRKSSFKRYRAYLDNFNNFMNKQFAAVIDIRYIREIYIKKFLDSLFDRGLMAKTINGNLTIVKQMFKYAVSQRHMKENPVRTLKKFPLPAIKKAKYFSKEKLNAIFRVVDPHWRDALEFIALTGLRKGELINLEFSDFDEAHATITVQEKPDWIPKNRQLRTIPLNRKALEIVKGQHKSQDHNYVFKGKEGNKVHRDKIYVALKKALLKAGLSGNIHKLRHTYASHLAMGGVDQLTIAELLGHSDVSMTKIYSHLAPGHLKKAVDKLDDLI